MSERLGVFGGTFDPIHLGHLRAAEVARETLGLDRVLFVPSGQPPHRPPPVAAAIDRFAMLALATAAHPAFVLSDLELEGDGPAYTVKTLDALRRQLPASEMFLILGADAFAEMGSWREPQRLLGMCTVAVVERPGVASTAGNAPAGARVVRMDRPTLPFSSSEVRRLIKEGRSVRYVVAETVADYIDKRELYR
jgi:nicotinate-nucleotide adenylyltransferase